MRARTLSPEDYPLAKRYADSITLSIPDSQDDIQEWADSLPSDQWKRLKAAVRQYRHQLKRYITGSDEWQTIPLSSVIRMVIICDSSYLDDGESDLMCYNPMKRKTVKGYRNMLDKSMQGWQSEQKSGYIEHLCCLWGEFWQLAKPMLSAIEKIDPLFSPSQIDPDLGGEMFKHSLIYDDIQPKPITTVELSRFIFGGDSLEAKMDCLHRAARENRADVLVGIGINECKQGADRYQALLQKRQSELGSRWGFDYNRYRDHSEYAAEIHPLLPNLLKWPEAVIESLKEANDEKDGFKKMFMHNHSDWQKREEMRQAKDRGDWVRRWWNMNGMFEDNRIIITEILGFNLDGMLQLGIDKRDCHALLGISASANRKEINQAYKRLAAKHHPDKGGDHVMMQQLNQARSEAMDLRSEA